MIHDPNPLAHLWAWVEIHVGAQNEAGSYYGFWSGFGSDLSEITLVAALIAGLRHINCHEHGCWRMSRHTTADGHRLCKKHVSQPKSDLNLHPIHEDHL